MIHRVLDAFLRALGHAFLPRVIGMTLLPLLVMTVAALGLGYFFWDAAVAWMQGVLGGWSVMGWLDGRLQVGWPGGLAALLAPLALAVLVTPLIVLASLVLVSTWMTPALARLVAERRFPALQRQGGASLLASIGWSAGSMLVAVLALLVTLPLWLIPPLILLLPPLIWGWLTYRVMSFDALADFATGAERAAIFKAHRWPLLAIGIATGYMGAAPSIVWASGVLFAALFVVLVPLAIWIYTYIFVFSSLWIAHYCLEALQQLRASQSEATTPPPAPPAGALPPADARSSITDVPWRDASS